MANPHPTEYTCNTCFHFNNGLSECRFNPPKITSAYSLENGSWYERTVWPGVQSNDWCGQHSNFKIVPNGQV